MPLEGYTKRFGTNLIIGLHILLAVATLAGCDRKTKHIRPLIAVSPDGKKMAMSVSLCVKKYYYPYGADIVIADTNSLSKPTLIKDYGTISSLVWRSDSENYELFVNSNPLSNKPSSIAMVKFSDNDIKVTSTSLPESIFGIWDMVWNDTGRILAGNVWNRRSERLLWLYYADSNESVVTDIPAAAGNMIWNDNIVWKDSETLYLFSNEKIVTVSIANRKYRVIDSFPAPDDVYLVGILNGELVCYSTDKIYIGNKILYDPNDDIRTVVIDSPYIAAQIASKQNRKILALDNKGNLINEKELEKGCILIDVVGDYVYLLENWKFIKRYNISDNTKVSTVFSVDDF